MVEFEPIETLSSNKHFSHKLESLEGPFFLLNLSLTNTTPCPIKQFFPISTNSQMKVGLNLEPFPIFVFCISTKGPMKTLSPNLSHKYYKA